MENHEKLLGLTRFDSLGARLPARLGLKALGERVGGGAGRGEAGIAVPTEEDLAYSNL